MVILIEPTISSDGCGQLEEDVGAPRNRYLIVGFRDVFSNIVSRVYLIPSLASVFRKAEFWGLGNCIVSDIALSGQIILSNLTCNLYSLL